MDSTLSKVISIDESVCEIISDELNLGPLLYGRNGTILTGTGHCGMVHVKICFNTDRGTGRDFGFMFIKSTGSDSYCSPLGNLTSLYRCPIIYKKEGSGWSCQDFARKLIMPFRKGLYQLDKATMSEELQADIMKMMG